ncbi:MAG: hypothetical protein OER12_01550 [Acidimicrobiia bacterium]|nr:hypothetical protein [Acidimicrobiia bacterium]
MNRFLLLLSALALVAAACAASRDEISEEFFPPVTSSSTTGDTTTTTTTTTLPPVETTPEQAVEKLADTVRDIRQLAFDAPSVEYRSADDIASGYDQLHGLPRTGDDRVDTAYLRMLGVLGDNASFEDLQSSCSLPGFYDPVTNTIALVEGLRELTPRGRSILVHELVAASTNQNYRWWDGMRSAQDGGDSEASVGVWGLVQGDAAFHAAQYETEVLTATDRFAITLEQVNCERDRLQPRGYVLELESYGPEVGRAYVEELLSVGGVEMLDEAYASLPQSSEQIYHPTRPAEDRPDLKSDLDSASITGFSVVDVGTLGERRFRAILSEGVGDAQALQAATGWGNDSYRMLWNGSDLVLVVTFEGDRAADAQELAETLGGWASDSLSVGAGRPDNTGLAFEGEEYAFVSHRNGTMLMVLSNDAAAGREVRDRFWPAW